MVTTMSKRLTIGVLLAVTLSLMTGIAAAWGQGRLCLDLGTYHIGNGDFSGTTDPDVVAENPVVGPKWSIAFTADRPILCWLEIGMLYGVGGGMPDYADCATVSIDSLQVGTIRPPDNHRPWASVQVSLSDQNPQRMVTVHACPWQGDYDDLIFREVTLVYTPAEAQVSVIGEGQVLQEEQQYTGTAYVGPHQGIRLDALPDGGALQWGPGWKVVRAADLLLFMRMDGLTGVVLPRTNGVDPFVLRPWGVGAIADSATGQWREVEAPWVWAPARGRQPTDYVNPTPCTVGLGGAWSITFYQNDLNRWMILRQGFRSLWLGDDGHITYFDLHNTQGFCLTR